MTAPSLEAAGGKLTFTVRLRFECATRGRVYHR